MNLVPLAKLDLGPLERKYLLEAFDSGYLTHAGTFEDRFEKEFGNWIGRPALATSSGTAALHLALLSLGVGPGDECIVPDLTFGATASVVLAVGARPVLVDVDPETWGLDKNRLSSVLTRRTRAILPVHLYGEDAGSFREFGIPVIEDACESLGMVSLQGDLACYSFYGNKPITTGEGGMLVGAYGNARLWRDGGFDSNYRHSVPGLNYRMSNLQAAVGVAQLERADDLIASRLRNAEAYQRSLKGRGKWLFCAEVDDPRKKQEELRNSGIETRPVFTPLHLCPAYRVYAKGKYKNSEDIWMRHLALPTGPHLKKEDQDRIIELVAG